MSVYFHAAENACIEQITKIWRMLIIIKVIIGEVEWELMAAEGNEIKK